ncbi:ATP-binding protein [Halomonas vilamensis]|uniref:histidine kinase n=1 Tax=Vreelandella vilamensis TaxID=531309 RepID=A0ABU1H7T8_9GAMM|nr:ATP-binding protein [Halomonas vilamensis]MDR5900363.1 ATP-binding protein [Halomonas vilamensis]
MQPPNFPEDELERLAALHAQGLLDTSAEERFDRLTRIAQQALGVSTVLVSLIDSDRQWFKSRQGLAASETPRNISFCGHAILGRALFEVPNALEDTRFHDNPLVTGAPFIRFYAGMPLYTPSGYALGTLCLLDPTPRELDNSERQLLTDLAACVEAEINQQAIDQVRERAEQMKGEFVSMVSHELRTPLTSISGALGLVTSGVLGTFSAEANQMLAIAHSNSKRLTFLINDLLDMEKLSAGKMRFDLKPEPLAPLVYQAVEALATYGREREVAITIQEPVANATVTADAQRLQQVLANLLSNALKFSHAGGCVVLSAEHKGDVVEISVQDEGEGVPAAFQSRLFEKFAQAENIDTRTQGGTGLGLAISREIVERMGGEIGFHSVEGKGARFYFTLPVNAGSDTVSSHSAQPTTKATATKATTADKNDWQILVIEDDLDLPNVLKAQMGENATVEKASTLAEARALVGLERFDVIVLDIGMPDGSGWTLVPEIRAYQPKARIVVLTAQEVSMAEEIEVDEVLLKTRASPEALVAAIGRPLNNDRNNERNNPESPS